MSLLPTYVLEFLNKCRTFKVYIHFCLSKEYLIIKEVIVKDGYTITYN